MNHRAPTTSVRARQQGLSMREALLFCQTYGKPMTFSGLKYIGKAHKFIRKAKDGFHWVVDAEKLKAYLKHAEKEPPLGWFTIRDCAKKLGISPKTIYVWMDRYSLNPRFYGAGKGVIYLELNNVRRTLGLD